MRPTENREHSLLTTRLKSTTIHNENAIGLDCFVKLNGSAHTCGTRRKLARRPNGIRKLCFSASKFAIILLTIIFEGFIYLSLVNFTNSEWEKFPDYLVCMM